ncbi:MAG TPA: hypothetical protein VIX59_01380 [Candidatus Binataceae bacterium]
MAPRAVSLLRCSPALVLVAIAVADAVNLADNDLWGHVRFGQAMLAAGHIIRADPYSYSAAGHLWLDHEWLSEVIMAAAYNSLGVWGLKLLKLALTAATFVFLSMADAETGAPTPVQLAVLLSCAVSVAMQMQFRPQLFSFALLSALIFLLARDTYQRRREVRPRLWLAIPIFLLWANLHGGFIAGLATLGVYAAVSSLQDLWAGRGARRACQLGAVTAAAALATIVTPYGIGVWRAVWHALTNPFTHVAILDWQPFARALAAQWRLSPAGSIEYMFAIAMVAAFVAAIVLGPATDDLPLVAVGSLMTAAAVMSVRNLPLALFTIAPPLAHHLALALKSGPIATAEPPQALAAPPRMRWWWIREGVWFTAALAILAAGGLFSNRLRSDDYYPSGAVRFMKSHGLRGNVLNGFDWGEYLIWHLEPTSKVFVDGRSDSVYPDRVLNETIAFQFNQPEVAQVVGADPRDYVLIPGEAPANRLMAARADWKLVYRDEFTRLYARRGSAAAGNPGVRVVIQQPGAAEVLAGYPHDFVLLPDDTPANQLMETRAEWKLVYRDQYARLYARAGSAAAQIPGVPIVGKAEATNFP